MGSDPSATLCFGYAFPGEDVEFPWSRYDDIEDWWMEVNEFENPAGDPYDAYGNRLPGVREEDEDLYWNTRREWRRANPVPVEVVTCYSYDYPGGYVLTTKAVTACSPDGGPDKLNESIFSNAHEASLVLEEFCKKYNIETSGEPAWYLTSFYG
jgi:hypothetical protein